MESLLAKFLSFPPNPTPPIPLSDSQYDDGICTQIDGMRNMTDRVLLQETAGGGNALDVINPACNSVPYLFILRAHLASTSKQKTAADVDKRWLYIVNFLQNFDARQIRYLGTEFRGIVESAAVTARQSRQPRIAIPLIADAILRLDPSGSVLTSSHIMLAQLAIDAREFAGALPVLEKPIMYFPLSGQITPTRLCTLDLPPTAWITANSGFSITLKSTDVLNYFMMSSQVFIGARAWQNALESLENVITYPTMDLSVSKLMVDAYKKWVLVSLLHAGTLPPLPASTSNAPSRTYHIIGKPYEIIATHFQTGTVARFRSEVACGRLLWAEDRNLGLIREVMSTYQKFAIRRLVKTYNKISVPDIATLTTSAETGTRLPADMVETMVREMINDGSLNATMSQSPKLHAVLSFWPAEPVISEAEMQRDLTGAMARVEALTRQIKSTDRVMMQHSSFLDHMHRGKTKNKMSAGVDLGMDLGMELDWNNMVEDEDIMTGY